MKIKKKKTFELPPPSNIRKALFLSQGVAVGGGCLRSPEGVSFLTRLPRNPTTNKEKIVYDPKANTWMDKPSPKLRNMCSNSHVQQKLIDSLNPPRMPVTSSPQDEMNHF